jgi:hypothetical protein
LGESSLIPLVLGTKTNGTRMCADRESIRRPSADMKRPSRKEVRSLYLVETMHLLRPIEMIGEVALALRNLVVIKSCLDLRFIHAMMTQLGAQSD